MDIVSVYEDNHLLVINKPNGIPTQGDATGDESLLELAKVYIKKKYNKPGNVYLGMVHRLDKPVSGLIVFARTSKSASRLSEQIRNKEFSKTYWAIVSGCPPEQASLTDYLIKKEYGSQVSKKNKGQESVLHFKKLKQFKETALLEIVIETGRKHQIRVQLANQGHPILGDKRYGSSKALPSKYIALHARRLGFKHPTQDEPLSFEVDPPAFWQPFMS